MSERRDRFDDGEVKAILARAIDLDRRAELSLSENDVRMIAAELDVGPASLEQALREVGHDILPRADQRRSTARRWALPVIAAALGPVAAVFVPEALSHPNLIGGWALAVVMTFASAAGLYWADRQQARLRISSDGIHYGATGNRILRWASVVEVKTLAPGILTVVGLDARVAVRLQDFEHPERVLATIKLRSALAASETLR